MTCTKNIVIIGSSRRCSMDERTRKSSGTTRQMQNKNTTQRTRSAQNGSNRKRRNGASRRRRKRNLAFKMSILVLIVIGIVGGAFLLKRYSPSKEKAEKILWNRTRQSGSCYYRQSDS